MKLSILCLLAVLGGPPAFSSVIPEGPPAALRTAAVQVQEPAQTALLGTWRGTTGPLRKRVLVLEAGGVCSLDGVAGSWSSARAGEISIQTPGETLNASHERDGKRLTLIVDGKRSRMRLQSDAKPSPAVASPEKPAMGAPFAGARPAVDLRGWPGEYRSGDWQLRLTPSSGKALAGTLKRSQQSWDVALVPGTEGASGCLSSGTSAFAFELIPEAAGLVLRCGTERLTFSRVGGPPRRSAGPALEGVATSPAQTYRDPNGHFSFEMPAGWTAEATEVGLIINPGFKATDTLDALIIVATGRLESSDRGQTPAQLIDRDEPTVRQEYSAQGIRLNRPRKGATSVQVGSYPGAYQEWKGTIADGRAVDAWVGGATAKGYYITVGGIIVSERQAEFLPHVKRILSTMALNPPDRRPELERQFIGKKIRQSTTNESGFFGTTYEFSGGGRVTSQSLMSGSLGLDTVSSSVSDEGEYTIVGSTLYMTFPGSESSFDLVVAGNRVSGVRMGGKIRALE